LIGINGCHECNDDVPAATQRVSVYSLRTGSLVLINHYCEERWEEGR